MTRITPTVSSSRIAQSLDNFANKQLDKVEKAFPNVFQPNQSDLSMEVFEQFSDEFVNDEQPLTRQKSRWEMVVANIGGYVVSSETMQRLRYCLEWLTVIIRFSLFLLFLFSLFYLYSLSTHMLHITHSILSLRTLPRYRKD